MTMTDTSTFDPRALAGDEVTELFGWPVSVLDELADLRDQAYDGQVWISDWRRREAELRASGPAQADTAAIGAARQAADKAWIDSLSDDELTQSRLLRLSSRLGAALRGAPDDAGLHERLAWLEAKLSDAADEADPEIARLRESRNLLASWLDPAVRDDLATRPER